MLRRALFGAALGVAGLGAQAWEIEGEVGYAAAYSDNMARVEHGRSDWEHRPSVRLGVTEQSSALTLQSEYRFEHREYADDTFADDDILSGTTQLRWRVVPERFEWLLSHGRTERPIRSRSAFTPDNSQITNVIATGPSVQFKLDARTQGSVSAQYQQATSDRTSNDNTRAFLNLDLRRAIDPRSTLGFVVSHSDINFDSRFGQDYRATDARLVYSRSQGARTQFDAEFGAVRLENDPRLGFDLLGNMVEVDGGNQSTNWSGKLSLRRQFSSSLTGSLLAERRVSDSGADIGSGIAQFGNRAEGRSDSRRSYIEQAVRLGITRTGARLTLGARLDYVGQDYDGQREDETRRGVYLNADYDLTPRTNLAWFGRYIEIKFQGVSGTDEQRETGTRLSWRPREDVSLSTTLSWEDRQGIDVEYDELRVDVGATVRF